MCERHPPFSVPCHPNASNNTYLSRDFENGIIQTKKCCVNWNDPALKETNRNNDLLWASLSTFPFRTMLHTGVSSLVGRPKWCCFWLLFTSTSTPTHIQTPDHTLEVKPPSREGLTRHFRYPLLQRPSFFRVSRRPSTKKGGICHGKPCFPKHIMKKTGIFEYGGILSPKPWPFICSHGEFTKLPSPLGHATRHPSSETMKPC